MRLLIFLLVMMTLSVSTVSWSSVTTTTESSGNGWDYKPEMLRVLVKQIPGILDDQETTSGRFGEGVWIVNDQHAILPLAVAWNTKDPANPYYHDTRVLEAIMDGGDALIADQDKDGRWEFRKKDKSMWGPIYMPWTYSRWIRTYGIVREAMPMDRREKWDKALLKGYTGIARDELSSGIIQNIPAHHAMGLYRAGQIDDRKDWREQATRYLHLVAEDQKPAGYWTEHVGPVVGYNFVYVDALGAYYAMSGDKAVLPALENSAHFHAACTYPNGSAVETVDERQVYNSSIGLGSVGFSYSPYGRAYLRRQWEKLKHRPQPVSAEVAAMYLLHGQEGPLDPTLPELGEDCHFEIENGKALLHGQGPWFVAVSAYTAPVPPGRWILDRQNLISIYREGLGLIAGGGNTKLQPLWSTFTLGDITLLSHKPGDRNPSFLPPHGLWHVPSSARTIGKDLKLISEYNGVAFNADIDVNDTTVTITYSLDSDTTYGAEAHFPLMAKTGTSLRAASGREEKIGEKPFELTADDAGAWVEHNGWRVSLPPGSHLTWPALPHNQYRIDGAATAEEGRLVLTIPLRPARTQKVEVTSR